MSPCVVINFFLNNQPDTLIIPNLFCYKTLHVSVIFSAHHQEFSTVHSALVSFMTVSKQSQDGTAVPSWICLKAVIKNLHEYYQCRMYSRKLLRMGTEDAPKHVQFHPDSSWKRSSKTIMKLTSAECTVENSWWWAEKLPRNMYSSILTLLGSGHQKPSWNLPATNVQ